MGREEKNLPFPTKGRGSKTMTTIFIMHGVGALWNGKQMLTEKEGEMYFNQLTIYAERKGLKHEITQTETTKTLYVYYS